MPAIDLDRDTAHAAARRELDKPIYPRGSISQRVNEWIHELIYRIIEKGASMPGGWLTLTVLLIVTIAAVVVAVRITRRTIRTRRAGDSQLFDAAQLTAEKHRKIAESYAEQENWALAIRHRLRAVAGGLEESGTLDPAPGRTANELAAAATERLPALGAELTQSATAFNDVTYGERPGTQSAYQVIVDLDDHLRYRSSAGQFGAVEPVVVTSWTPVR